MPEARLSLSIILAVGLSALGDDAKPAPDVTDARVRAIDDEYQAAVRRLYEPGPDQDDPKRVEECLATRKMLVDRAEGLVRDHRGEPVAVDALTWILRGAAPNSDERVRALEELRREYAASGRIAEAVRRAPRGDGKDSLAAERFLREVIARNPDRRAVGFARFGLAEILEGRADLVHEVDTISTTFQVGVGAEAFRAMTSRPADDLAREAERLYGIVAADYADLDSIRRGKTLGEVAEGRAFKLRNLSVGRVAPEIAGEDVDGKPLKLSDYRGKVVVLSFTGLWCPTCKAQYPEERARLERFKGRPFAMLGVDTDEDQETLRKAIRSGEITWPCLWDGGKGGPITLGHGIFYFPTDFLIDHNGVVRHKGLLGKPLDDAAESLVREAERAARP